MSDRFSAPDFSRTGGLRFAITEQHQGVFRKGPSENTVFRLKVVINWIFFLLVSRKIHGNAKKMQWFLLSPGIMFHKVATLVDLIESSKPAARAHAVRWNVPLKVPRLLQRRPCLTVPRELSFWRDKALHYMTIAADFVLISAMSVSRLCRVDE